MTDPAGVYPLATPSGESIPFDVLKPVSLASLAVNSTSSVNCTLPEDTALVILFSRVDTLARLGTDITSVVNGTFYSSMIFIPANTAISVLLSAGTLYFKSVSESGIVRVQLAEQWNSLGIGVQYSRI